MQKVVPRMTVGPNISWPTRVVELLGVASAYFALARVGQILAIAPGNVTPVWPASGFALAIVLLRGYRTWLGLWVGVAFANTWPFLDLSSISDGLRTIAAGIAIGPGAIGQAFLGAYLVKRFCSPGETFGQVRNVFVFVGTQAIACLASATFGVLALCVGRVMPMRDFAYTWMTWYLGDGVGIILFAPALLTLGMLPPVLRDFKRLAEATAILLLSAVASFLVFNNVFQPSLSFLLLPLVLWAAVRADQFAVSCTVLVIVSVALWGTSQGRGPFATEDTNVSLLILQLYAATTVVTGSAVTAAISERRQAEKYLRQTGSRLAQALRGGNVGLWDWDVLTDTVYYSPQLKMQLGYDPDEPWDTYQEWESRLHPDDKAAAVQLVRDYLNGDLPEYISTFRLRRKDGTYAWILSQGQAEWDIDNSPLRLIGVHVDVTESRLHQQELERMNLELQQMAYAASHDLQEPLRSITSFSQLVDRKYRDLLDEDGRSWLDSIVGSAKRMKELIGDLRIYTQLDAPIHSFESTDLGEVLDGALSNLDEAIRASGAEVTHGRLPVIKGNASQLTQLFQNLVGNAIKYRDEKPPRIQISAERNGENWIFSVSDNGIGIEAKHHSAIFYVFRRLHHRHEQPGTGVGLAICRRVVQRHHGNIWVESAPGEGSTFRFAIPLQTDEVKP